MTSFLPSALNYATSVLDGVSVNTFQLLPNSSTSVSPSGQVSVAIPDGALVGLDTLRMYGTITATGAGDATAVPSTKVYARLPQINDMISRATVSVNGIQVNGANGSYGDSMSMSTVATQDFSRSQSVENTLSNGNIIDALADQSGEFCWHNWQNIFGHSSAKIVSTGMIGSMVLTVTLQDNSCLVPAGAGGIGVALTADEIPNRGKITYTLTNVRFTCDCYSIAGGFYDALLEQRLQEGPIALNYLETYFFSHDNQTGGSASARFSLATRCLDRVYAASRNGNYSDVGADALALTSGIGNPFRSNRTRFRCFDPLNSATYQVQLNNANAPAFRNPLVMGGANSAFSQTDEGMNNGIMGKGNSIYSLGDYNEGLGVVVQSYKMPSGLDNPYSVTCGLNTKGVNCSGVYSVQGQQGIDATDSAAVMVVCHTQAQLLIGMGRQVAVSF